MVKSFCSLLIYVNHAIVPDFNVAYMCFYAIHENKIFAKISEFTVNKRIQLMRANAQLASLYIRAISLEPLKFEKS